MILKLGFPTLEAFESAVELFYSDRELGEFEIDTSDGQSILVDPGAAPRLLQLGAVCSATLDAYESKGWDGAWAACPFCEHENGVSWTGAKQCTMCKQTLIVNPGPLVKPRPK